MKMKNWVESFIAEYYEQNDLSNGDLVGEVYRNVDQPSTRQFDDIKGIENNVFQYVIGLTAAEFVFGCMIFKRLS